MFTSDISHNPPKWAMHIYKHVHDAITSKRHYIKCTNFKLDWFVAAHVTHAILFIYLWTGDTYSMLRSELQFDMLICWYQLGITQVKHSSNNTILVRSFKHIFCADSHLMHWSILLKISKGSHLNGNWWCK